MKHGIIGWFACNPVAANLLMVLIIVSGLLATAVVTEEVFPEIDLDRIRVEVPYLGAAPEEVEAGVAVRIEEAIRDVDGIKEILSIAAEGHATVLVELELGADARRAVDDVKNKVDAITTLPVETERPIISELIARNQVVDIAVSGAADIFTLKAIAERIHDDLTALPEISHVVIPLVAIPCLLFSLVESLGILPAHLAHARREGAAGAWRRSQQRIAGVLMWFVRACYEPYVGGCTPLALSHGGDRRLQSWRLRARLREETGSDYFRHVAATVGDVWIEGIRDRTRWTRPRARAHVLQAAQRLPLLARVAHHDADIIPPALNPLGFLEHVFHLFNTTTFTGSATSTVPATSSTST